jgi:hypothetical protein
MNYNRKRAKAFPEAAAYQKSAFALAPRILPAGPFVNPGGDKICGERNSGFLQFDG